MVRILSGVMAALVFGVAVFTFFAFSENNYVADYGKIQKIVAANARVSSSKNSGARFSFNLKEADALSDETGSGDSDSESRDETSSSGASERRSSSSSASSSSVSGAGSSSASGSAETYSGSSGESPASSGEQSDVIPILGASVLTKSQLLAYSASHISSMRLTCSCEELIGYYLSVGAKYGVRGDIAYLQAIIETGWFKFNRPNGYYEYIDGKWVRNNGPRPEGYYVVPSDNNFCGLGVTGYITESNPLCRFETAALGVEAQIQHLYAYACKLPLPAGTTKIDPRFGLVKRGCAPDWNDLGGGNWAADTEYGKKILDSYRKVLNNY
ncbi:MAG: glucosaminidase domain-containing protein [Clostridia bacterium]|nr:glucosaminidase domain-containing protein [Clostridia bacterium]